MNKDVVKAWIKDLRAPPRDFPAFDADYEFLPEEYRGDGGCFVIARTLKDYGAPVNRKSISKMIGNRRVYAVTAERLGVSNLVAKHILDPRPLDLINYDRATITAEQFSEVVSCLLSKGVVDWSLILDEDKRKELLTKIEAVLAEGGTPA